jgi:archaellum component FlaG (FlaF/FlaG flagellin family)
MLDVLLAALTLPTLAMKACADPAITHVAAGPVANNGDLTTYDFAITVKNVGGANQPSSALNSILIYQDATKVDQKGAQPLRAGATETVQYRFQRSSEARPGTTRLRFQLMVSDPHAPVQNCSTANDTYRISV